MGGVKEGNSLKKHYVTEECVRGSVSEGPRLEGEKGGFVGADLAAGGLLEGVPLPVWLVVLYGSARLPLAGRKSLRLPPGSPEGSHCARVCSLSRGHTWALLTLEPPIWFPLTPSCFTSSPPTHPDSCCRGVSSSNVPLSSASEGRATTTGNSGSSHNSVHQ